MRDLANNFSAVTVVVPAVLTATNTATGVDLKGFNSAAVVISTGAIVGAAVMVPKLQESSDNVTYTDVAAGDLIGTFPASLAAASTYKVGYIGNRRYIRTVLTLNSGTSIAASAVAIRGNATMRPVA